jgi:serine/threonine protein kinase
LVSINSSGAIDSHGRLGSLLRGRRARDTRDQLRNLLEKAGLSEEMLGHFDVYLAKGRGSAGVQRRVLQDYVTQLMGQVSGFADEGEALQGEGFSKLGEALGVEGSNGPVLRIERDGKHYAFKRLERANQQDLVVKRDAAGDFVAPSAHVVSTQLDGLNLPGHLRPSHVLVEFTGDGSPEQVLQRLLPADAGFNAAIVDLHAAGVLGQGVTARIVGLVSPLAVGQDMGKWLAEGGAKHLTEDGRRALTVDMVGRLRDQMAAGLVHGGIKPENLFIDPKSQRLQFGDLASMSWHPGRAGVPHQAHTYTLGYALPLTLLNRRPGPDQDLFGAGLILLEVALRGAGKGDDFSKLQEELVVINEKMVEGFNDKKTNAKRNAYPQELSMVAQGQITQAIRKNVAEEGSAEHFARACIEFALKCANQRYPEAPGPMLQRFLEETQQTGRYPWLIKALKANEPPAGSVA